MDEPGEHLAKWNKPDTERQILCDSTYMWNLKKVRFLVTETKMVVSGAVGWRKWEDCGLGAGEIVQL